MADSTPPRSITKPPPQRKRPAAVLQKLRELGVRPDFPLFPSGNGLWAKKVRGRLHYFGPHSDPQGALQRWDDFQNGRTPKTEGLRLHEIVNPFIDQKKRLIQSGEITHRSFQDYYDTALRLAKEFGREMMVKELTPADFNRYRERIAKKWGPVALGNEVQRVRSIFKWAFDTGLLEVPMRFGPEFKKPKRRIMRRARNESPEKSFEPPEILALLAAAKPQMKAMILLGINCGWGNTDVAMVQLKHLDLDAGVAEFPRPKTEILRRATLWPETVTALKEAIDARPKPKHAEDAGCVFVTKYGERWKRVETVEDPGKASMAPYQRRKETDSVGLEFGKLLRKTTAEGKDGKPVKLKREGVNFYGLRHTFRTIAGQTGDIEVVDLIMGHEDAGKSSTSYREWGMDERQGHPRLRRVTDHVRTWLYGAEAVAGKPPG
ncbi:MAG TPA: tyrosine-type recombinase/integrase [Phycisphaerae bacterium]|nr:tyrosine-type recombinase/integrase [Phycisphaerae bacterium]